MDKLTNVYNYLYLVSRYLLIVVGTAAMVINIIFMVPQGTGGALFIGLGSGAMAVFFMVFIDEIRTKKQEMRCQN